jgi:hypothetical protein
MKITKMTLANIQGKLSRIEMKKINGASGTGCVSLGAQCILAAPFGKCCAGLACVPYNNGNTGNAGQCTQSS